jgi:hypothetical protein
MGRNAHIGGIEAAVALRWLGILVVARTCVLATGAGVSVQC